MKVAFVTINKHKFEEAKSILTPYDKIFIPKGDSRAVSEMTIEEKNKISHRYQALKKIGEYVKKS